MSFVDVSIIISTLEVKKPSLRENLPKSLQLGQVLLPGPACTLWVFTVWGKSLECETLAGMAEAVSLGHCCVLLNTQ